jgi:hypothetical protein
MPHATTHEATLDATLDDRGLATTAGPGDLSGWYLSVVGRFLSPPDSAVAARPGAVTARWYDTPGAARGF